MSNRPAAPTFDRWGRMHYNPDFHRKRFKAWTTGDQRYLIERYELDGPNEVSLALERTVQSVMLRAYELRKKGLMAPSKHARTYERPPSSSRASS